MTIEDAQKVVEQIKHISGDDERAHSLEDSLHYDVLRSIAEGCSDPSGLAKAALESAELDFCRWYA